MWEGVTLQYSSRETALSVGPNASLAPRVRYAAQTNIMRLWAHETLSLGIAGGPLSKPFIVLTSCSFSRPPWSMLYGTRRTNCHAAVCSTRCRGTLNLRNPMESSQLNSHRTETAVVAFLPSKLSWTDCGRPYYRVQAACISSRY